METNTNTNETSIYYSKTMNLLQCLGYLCMLILGLYMLIELEGYKETMVLISSIFFILIGSYQLIKNIREYLNNKPQIIFSDKGVDTEKHGFFAWENITEIKTYTHKSDADLYITGLNGEKIIELNDKDISEEEVNELINKYRSRFKKSKNGFKKFDPILEKLREDLDIYYSLEIEEMEIYDQKLMDYIDKNEVELKSFCKTLEIKSLSPLSYIYSLQSKNIERWENFLIDEYMRVFELGNQKLTDNMECIDEIYIAEMSKNGKLKVQNFLLTHLNSSEDNKRHATLVQLNQSLELKENLSINIENKLIDLLNDSNWKIRHGAYDILNSHNSNSNISIGIFDKLKGFFFNYTDYF